jgi:GNAT superfamily N-acetyltransferase
VSTSAKPLPAAQKLIVRRARPTDAKSLADLSGQLGYPATPAQVKERLRRIVPASQHAVFVAESPQAGVIGWLHVSVTHLLESDTRAEVNGLVVADGQRSLGAGAKLLEAAEQWARRRGCKNVNLRSNVIRERAHLFYLRQGYEHYKTQKAFRKPL